MELPVPIRPPILAPAAISALGIAALAALLPFYPALAGAVLTCVLAWLSVIDARQHLLPDILTLPLLGAGFALSLAGVGPGFTDAASGAVLGYGIIFAVALLYRRTRGIEAIGLGDAKLLAALGAWAGAFMLPFIVFCASMTGVLFFLVRSVRTSFSIRDEVPFGPFLALAGWVAFVCVHRNIEPMQFFIDRLIEVMD